MSTVIIIDDHPPLREGLKAIISRVDLFQVVGEGGTVEEAMSLIQEKQPDIAVVDISLPDSSGIELTKWINENFPNINVLIISMHAGQDFILSAFKAGALGYVTKEATSTRLLDALRVVEDGDMFIDHVCTAEIIRFLLRTEKKTGSVSLPRQEELTSREREILSLIADGDSTKQIAGKLLLSEKTVSNHRSNMMQKLGLSNVVELIRYAEKSGILH